MLSKYRNYIIFGLVGLSAVVFLAVAVLGISKLSVKSQELVDLKVQSKQADSQLTSLAATKKQVQKYSYFNDVAKTVIPNDKDQAQAVLDIFQMASESGIALQNINFPISSLGGATATTGAASSSTSTADTSTSSPLSQAKPVSGISGLYSLQLIVTPQVGNTVPAAVSPTFPKFLDFLNRIERDRRTAQITQVSITPQTNSSQLGFTLTLNIFVKP